MKVLYPVCIIFVLKIDIPMDILFLVGGLLLILLGANGLTDGAASVAKRFHIPSIVIGLTIVAFGTSAPELTVSISSALKGSADIAIGNVVGSNTFNTLMIVGCTALFAPIAITRNTLKREIPLCILSSFALLICANDVLLDSSGENILSITDGLLLLCFFTIFLSYTFAIAKRDGSMKEPEKEHLQEEDEIRLLPAWKSALYILGGLAGLIIGGNFFVDGASGIARGLGVSESIIGLTLVAGGTSLPELATSIVAALKKNPEIAIGNVIGRNLFNILRTGLFGLHHSTASDGHHQFRFVGTRRVQHPALAVRYLFRETHHHPGGRKHSDSLLHCLHSGTDIQPLTANLQTPYAVF